MKVYLDDVRDTPDGWVRAYTAKEAIQLLIDNNVAEISLDHDLGDESVSLCGNGYDVVKWIEIHAHCNKDFNIPKMTVHSSNPPARVRMEQAIATIYKNNNISY
jgi:hypothetical protein